jgi:hypothetical protein
VNDAFNLTDSTVQFFNEKQTTGPSRLFGIKHLPPLVVYMPLASLVVLVDSVTHTSHACLIILFFFQFNASFL